jgi:hypothetical protein
VRSIAARLTRTANFESYRHLHCLEKLVKAHPEPGGKDPRVIVRSAKRRDFRAEALACLGCRPPDPTNEIEGRPWLNGKFDCTRPAAGSHNQGRVFQLADVDCSRQENLGSFDSSV